MRLINIFLNNLLLCSYLKTGSITCSCMKKYPGIGGKQISDEYKQLISNKHNLIIYTSL